MLSDRREQRVGYVPDASDLSPGTPIAARDRAALKSVHCPGVEMVPVSPHRLPYDDSPPSSSIIGQLSTFGIREGRETPVEQNEAVRPGELIQ